MVYDIDSLQTKMIMERAPLLENPWNDEPSSTIKKRGRSVTRFFLYAATTASALLLLASLYVVDMYTSWPGGDAGHAGLPAAYRVLAENPLIGKLSVFVATLLIPEGCGVRMSCTVSEWKGKGRRGHHR